MTKISRGTNGSGVPPQSAVCRTKQAALIVKPTSVYHLNWLLRLLTCQTVAVVRYLLPFREHHPRGCAALTALPTIAATSAAFWRA